MPDERLIAQWYAMTPTSPAKGYVEAWDVESLSEPGKTYVVSRRKSGEFACSCPAWKFAKAPKPACKHICSLRNQQSSVETVTALREIRGIRVSFDGVYVATITQAEAESFRFGLTRSKPIITEPQTISGEFRITRKFRLED